MNQSSKKSATRRKVHTAGRIVNVPSRPLDLVPRPWYPVTVRISTLAVQVLNFETLEAHLLSQLGFSTSFTNLVFRLQHVKIWGPVNSTSSNTVTGQLHVRFHNPITDSVCQEIIRYPDVVNRSTVGYVYSQAVQETPVRKTAETVLQFLSPAAADVSHCVIHMHLLWRSIG
jgi:hypothetical protein